MTTKKYILVAFILLASNMIINAQTKNIDLDNLRYPIAYRSMPTKPFNPLFFTYSVSVNATKPTEQRISVAEIENDVHIEGQQRVNSDENAFLLIAIDLGNLVIKSSSVEERREEVKDKDGKVTSYSYYYRVAVVYTFASSYKVMQGNKVLSNYEVYSTSYPLTYKSQEYRNRRDAADYWNNNRDVLISEFTTELSKKTASTASSRESTLYGFPITRKTDLIKETDEKKHDENIPFKSACASLKEKFQAVTPEEGLKKDELERIIEYFKSIPTKYTDSKSKADIRLRFAAYFNLCKLYLYLDDPESVYQYADLLIKNEYEKKDGEKLKKAADELKEELVRTEIKTRHFNPEDYWDR